MITPPEHPWTIASPDPTGISLRLSQVCSPTLPTPTLHNQPHPLLDQGGREELLLFLLEHGADPNLKDGQGWTVLHQAAWNGDFYLLQYCIQKGKANSRIRNADGQLAVDLAAARNHTHIMHYLDTQSCDLSSMCRVVIHDALGKKCELAKLHLPPRMKLFIKYNIPYPGFSAAVVPPAPWTPAQLYQNKVGKEEVREFIRDHASEDFLSEHASSFGKGSEEERTEKPQGGDQELVRLFETMYLWDAFKTTEYEEPLARQPRYSMQKHEKTS